jgi:hypothetical protein
MRTCERYGTFENHRVMPYENLLGARVCRHLREPLAGGEALRISTQATSGRA